MHKIGIFVLIIMSIFFCGLSIYYYRSNIELQKSLSQVSEKAKAELESRLIKERELARKDLDEKYRADMVSFEVTARRLELEKKRAKELEEELKKLKGSQSN